MHFGIGIFHDQQAGRCMPDHEGQQAIALPLKPAPDMARKLVGACAIGLDDEIGLHGIVMTRGLRAFKAEGQSYAYGASDRC